MSVEISTPLPLEKTFNKSLLLFDMDNVWLPALRPKS